MQREELAGLARKYLVQQAEIHGKTFYVDSGATSPPVAAPRSGALVEFYQKIRNCEMCRLSQTRTHFVFGAGNNKAALMCIGEAPGYEEDRKGEPFVGAAGQLLDKILNAIGFARSEVYIANIIKCRPPDNRNPEEDEIASCMPYLRKQIDLIQPKLILALGRVAGQQMTGRKESLSQLRKTLHRFDDTPVFVTYHPAALLRNQQWKRETWEDVRLLRKHYDELVGDKPSLLLSAKSN